MELSPTSTGLQPHLRVKEQRPSVVATWVSRLPLRVTCATKWNPCCPARRARVRRWHPLLVAPPPARLLRSEESCLSPPDGGGKGGSQQESGRHGEPVPRQRTAVATSERAAKPIRDLGILPMTHPCRPALAQASPEN